MRTLTVIIYIKPSSISEQSLQPPLLSEQSADGTVCTRIGRTSKHPQRYRPDNSQLSGYTVLWL